MTNKEKIKKLKKKNKKSFYAYSRIVGDFVKLDKESLPIFLRTGIVILSKPLNKQKSVIK